jgi:hypothetical protein
MSAGSGTADQITEDASGNGASVMIGTIAATVR